MIIIPERIWEDLLDAFRWPKAQLERVAYLDGIRTTELSIVTTLALPHADLLPLRYYVTPEAMSQAGAHFRKHGLRRLAQVHTHPEDWTGHSPWDDELAYSQETGAVSIVLPYHAQTRPALGDAGVHVRTDTGWQELRSTQVQNYIRLVPSLLDFRGRP
jgi:hypothetical protein